MVLGAFGGGAALLAAVRPLGAAHPSPMLDVRLFRIGAFSGASGSIALVFFALFGSIFFLTQYLQGVLDYTRSRPASARCPIAAGLVVGGPLSAKLAERFGNRLVVAAGLTHRRRAGLALLAQVDVDSGYGLVAAVDGGARGRHGHLDGARHRVDHERAPARPTRASAPR